MARILIIEDSASVRQMLAECLKYDYEVMTAQDGLNGIEVAESYQPDLIICDINMPDMDGFSVLRHFQNTEQLIDIPFIFLSGDDDRNTIRQGMTLGADDFLTKPFLVEELLHVVKNRLEKQTRRQALVKKAIDELGVNITTALPHELRTAIMIVEGYAQLVLEDADKIDEQQREMVEAIRQNAARLRHMAEKYVWYLKAYLPGKTEENLITRHPDLIIENIAQDIARNFDRSADLSITVEAGHLPIREEYLSKIIEEIIENAFKFSKAGTPVSVDGIDLNQHYIITISDFGYGVSQDQTERISGFMQFDRAKYEQQGTGLGLTIAKRLVELSGGQLTIDSIEGKTTVVVTLPNIILETFTASSMRKSKILEIPISAANE